MANKSFNLSTMLVAIAEPMIKLVLWAVMISPAF